ncbi:MAG: PIN domain-containing protein [Hydrogenophilaceae bacterium]|jgi:predicted nucleic acid-binding protein|nr:PIN domain-containing protein [Hydrogenophilaceae bacterium]
MARVSLDSNVLIYAALEPQTVKGRHAQDLVARAAVRGVLSSQALLEFVAVVRRRAPALTEHAIAQAEAWSKTFETAPTTDRVVAEALSMVRLHQFQVWDGVIWAAARQAGVAVLFSEDLQDGFAKDGMRTLNPFLVDAANLQRLIDA